MIPKIVFRYSEIYDSIMKENLQTFYKAYKKPKAKSLLKEYPSRKKIENYIAKMNPLWSKEEKKVLQSISKVTGLKWQEKIIKVYMIGYCRPFSDPVTMRLYNNSNEFIDVLTHELIHQIQSQNSIIFKKWSKYVIKKYNNETRRTKSHILLHAVHKKIYLELFDEKRLKRNIKRSIRPSYAKAWAIVEKEGHENIIKKFKEII